jgi:hypothetical protein
MRPTKSLRYIFNKHEFDFFMWRANEFFLNTFALFLINFFFFAPLSAHSMNCLNEKRTSVPKISNKKIKIYFFFDVCNTILNSRLAELNACERLIQSELVSECYFEQHFSFFFWMLYDDDGKEEKISQVSGVQRRDFTVNKMCKILRVLFYVEFCWACAEAQQRFSTKVFIYLKLHTFLLTCQFE